MKEIEKWGVGLSTGLAWYILSNAPGVSISRFSSHSSLQKFCFLANFSSVSFVNSDGVAKTALATSAGLIGSGRLASVLATYDLGDGGGPSHLSPSSSTSFIRASISRLRTSSAIPEQITNLQHLPTGMDHKINDFAKHRANTVMFYHSV